VKVIVADEAEIDLEDIADRIAADNPARALSFVRELRTICSTLSDRPLAWPLVPNHERGGVRRRVHGAYLVFFRVVSDAVIVLRILHGARDYGPILFPDD
jgi:plasmid stabilization system protein ParE